MKIVGTVVRGQGFAMLAFGLPTANLEIEAVVTLAPGVYVGYALAEGARYNSVIYIGPQGSEKFEVHLFGFTGELYGQSLEIEMGEMISPSVPWESEEQMKAKVAADVALAKAYFAGLDKTTNIHS